MDVKRIVKDINTSVSTAKMTIANLSDDQIIELRAELEESKTHYGKWMNAFIVFFAAILGILSFNAKWVSDQVMVGLLFFNSAVLVIHCVTEWKNGKKVRALSILNDITKDSFREGYKENKQPLISPLARKYYNYASEKTSKIHHRAGDIRICLEKICDEILFDMVSEKDQRKWKHYILQRKLEIACQCIGNKDVYDKLYNAKVVGNKGVHEGEEGDYSELNIEESLEAIHEFSLEVLLTYLIKNGFNQENDSWLPTVFSTLPPTYRIQILEKYYLKDSSPFVIDKLSKAYVKDGKIECAEKFLNECYKNNKLTENQFYWLKNDIMLLSKHLDKLPIAKNLEDAMNNFNSLLPSINEEKRTGFTLLISSILNGKKT